MFYWTMKGGVRWGERQRRKRGQSREKTLDVVGEEKE
jgi:hypothetical protein